MTNEQVFLKNQIIWQIEIYFNLLAFTKATKYIHLFFRWYDEIKGPGNKLNTGKKLQS